MLQVLRLFRCILLRAVALEELELKLEEDADVPPLNLRGRGNGNQSAFSFLVLSSGGTGTGTGTMSQAALTAGGNSPSVRDTILACASSAALFRAVGLRVAGSRSHTTIVPSARPQHSCKGLCGFQDAVVMLTVSSPTCREG